jgi:hypothetical protein
MPHFTAKFTVLSRPRIGRELDRELDANRTGRTTTLFQSVLGDLDLERAYYHCSRCGQGFCPRDRQLGLENTSLSPAITG